MSENRDANVDYEIFEAYGITHQWHQPWQLGLFHANLPDGYKFVWYPERGTLMYEQGSKNAHKIGEFTDSESVALEIRDRI